MKNILYLVFGMVLLSFNQTAYSQAPNYLWAQKSGSVNGISIAAVTVDASGNSYIAGRFSRAVTIAGTLLDAGSGSGMFIAKYSASGVGLWAKKAVGNDSILPNSLALDSSGNLYVGGSFYATTFTMNGVTLTNSDASTTFQDDFVLKLNPSGTVLWGNKYISNNFGNDSVFDMAVDNNGNVFLAGWNHNSTSNSRNGAILKINTDGALMWYKGISGTVTEQADCVSVDATGNVYVAGKFDSSSITFGTTTLTNAGGYDMFIVKYDNGSNLLWAKSVTNTNNISPEGMDVDPNGNLYLMGYFNSPSVTFGTTTLNNTGTGLYSYFVGKFDPDGNSLWAVRPTGGSTNVGAGGLAVDSLGNSFITGGYTATNLVFGSTTLTNAGGQDIFLARYNTSGNAVWAKSIGNVGDDYGGDIALGPNGNCHVIGNFLSFSLTFGSTVLTNQGNAEWDTEYFLTKLDNITLAADQFSTGTDGLKIYPNPVRNQFEIASETPVEKVEVYSMLGQLVKSFAPQTQYHVSDLPKGNYLIKITSADATTSRKVLVE